MVADALVPYVTKSSATMALNMYEKQFVVFHKEGFPLPVPSQHFLSIINTEMIVPAYAEMMVPASTIISVLITEGKHKKYIFIFH